QVYEPPGKRQAEPDTLLLQQVAVKLLELLEDDLQLGRVDADAVVRYRDARVAAVPGGGDMHRAGALRAELDRVVDEAGDCVVEVQRESQLCQGRVDLGGERHAALLGVTPVPVRNFLDDAGKRHPALAQLDLKLDDSALKLEHQHQVADEVDEALRAAVHALQHSVDFGFGQVAVFVAQHVDVAVDDGERGAQLVAEGRDEPLLHLLDVRHRRCLDVPRPAQAGLDGDEQVFRLERLGDVRIRPQRLAAPHVGRLAARGQEDEWNGGPGGVVTYSFIEGIAIHARHHDVGDHQVGHLLLHDFQRRFRA